MNAQTTCQCDEKSECAWCESALCHKHSEYKTFEWGLVCQSCWNEKLSAAMDAETELEKLLAGRDTYRELISVDASEHSFHCHHCHVRIEDVGAVEFVIASKHFGTRSCCSSECAMDYLEPQETEIEECTECWKNVAECRCGETEQK